MTAQEARKRLEAIKAMAGDDEAAHSAEDALRRDILEAIQELSEIALETSLIDFARWCA
jgi:septum formation topological specificity factor MinE